MAEDVAAGVHSLRALLKEVEEGDGVLHALIYDKQASRDVKVLVANASRAALRVDKAVGHVEAMLDEVRTGDGTAHALIYGGEGTQAIQELGSAAGQLAGLLQDAKDNPNGAVHQLVYGDGGGMLADLGSAAADIKQMTSMVARGEGSLGGLIKDPTVYEDLRDLVGNVKRNKVLRTLVRFAIDNNENVSEAVGRPLAPLKKNDSPRGIGGSGHTPPLTPPPPPPVPPSPAP
jgi:phospholipid/cholesterol/gamma-HCH transport system substrate-binding protein